MKNYTLAQSVFFYLILAVIFYLLAQTLSPFIESFIFAGVFATILLPAHRYLKRKTKLPSTLIAGLLLLVLSLGVFLPSYFILWNVYMDISHLLEQFSRPERALDLIYRKIFIAINNFSPIDIPFSKLRQQAKLLEEWIASQSLNSINYMLSNSLTFLGSYLFFLLILFVFLTQGKKVKETFFAFSFLPTQDEELLLKRFEQLNRVLLVGNTIGGLVQGLAGFVLLGILGQERLFFWSLLILLSSFVPVVGTALVYLPFSLYFWLTDDKASAIVFFSVMSLLFILMENWFKPTFIGGRIKMHSVFILFCLLGGVKAFGLSGLFYGPILGVIFTSLIEIHQLREVKTPLS